MPALIERIEHGPIQELQLARPPVNAFNPELSAALTSAIASSVAEGAGGLVLSGLPGIFSAGMDVPWLLSVQHDAEALANTWETYFDTARALTGSPVPVAAAITGHAPAGGCLLTLCCDYRVMAEGPFALGLNEVQVGIPVPAGVFQLMQRTVGQRQAELLVIGGQMVDAARALDIGLVDELAAPDQVVSKAAAWLESRLALPQAPMLATRAAARADLKAALRKDQLRLDEVLSKWHNPDTQRTLQALVEKLGKPSPT